MIPYLNRHYLRSCAKTLVKHALAIAPARMRVKMRTAVERVAFSFSPPVDTLPPIFLYWANKHLRPQFLTLGFGSPQEFFLQQMQAVVERERAAPARILSIGCGRCETEIQIAASLRAAGLQQFVFHCLDINQGMLQSAAELAVQAGVREHFEFRQCEAQGLQVGERYDAVMAVECLHHIVELEQTFDAIHGCLEDDGVFVTADVIGRNGHQLWPEALAEVQTFWARLPDHCKFDRALGNRSRTYRNYDHSNVAFEGIRAQDILRLLVERFHFEVFAAHTCIVLPFVERRFGWNFDPAREFDTRFIDEVAGRDQQLLIGGQVKPTQLVAAMRKTPVATPRWMNGLEPASCIRAT